MTLAVSMSDPHSDCLSSEDGDIVATLVVALAAIMKARKHRARNIN